MLYRCYIPICGYKSALRALQATRLPRTKPALPKRFIRFSHTHRLPAPWS